MDNQNIEFSRILSIAGGLFSMLLDKNDMLSLYQTKKIVKAIPFIRKNSSAFLSENNAINALFISINLGIIWYQYAYASWFLYLFTTFSGVKKLCNFVFSNPLLGVFFFLSFYFQMLTTPDKEKFDAVAKFFHLPKHADIAGDEFLISLVNNIPDKIAEKDIWGLKEITRSLLGKVATIVVSTGVASLPTLLEKIGKSKTIKEIPDPAVYIHDKDVQTDAELREWYDYISANSKKIRKDVKKQISAKKKRKYKTRLQQIIEKRTDKGEVICLDACEERTKTRMGCYCESNCGKSFFSQGKTWCYVDPTKCKKGKHLLKHMGKSYDFCNKKDLTEGKKCYTGTRYKDCKVT